MAPRIASSTPFSEVPTISVLLYVVSAMGELLGVRGIGHIVARPGNGHHSGVVGASREDADVTATSLRGEIR
ncbi:hypothetical protein GCM10023201_22080 [Actinomycetospora corticicola]